MHEESGNKYYGRAAFRIDNGVACREGLPHSNFLLGSYGCQLRNIPDTATSTALLLELISIVRLLIRLCTEHN